MFRQQSFSLHCSSDMHEQSEEQWSEKALLTKQICVILVLLPISNSLLLLVDKIAPGYTCADYQQLRPFVHFVLYLRSSELSLWRWCNQETPAAFPQNLVKFVVNKSFLAAPVCPGLPLSLTLQKNAAHSAIFGQKLRLAVEKTGFDGTCLRRRLPQAKGKRKVRSVVHVVHEMRMTI